MIGVFAATKMEIAGLRKRTAIEERTQEEGCVVERGQCNGVETLLVQFGMGKARAQRAVEAVLSRYPLDAVVSLGFSGALTDDLQVGDVIVCGKIRHSGGDDDVACDANLLSKAMALSSSRLCVIEGIGATSDAFVPDVDTKRRIASELGATAVDMESHWIGRAAVARGLPFLSVRAISDCLTARLPPIERFIDADGRMRRRSMAACCLRRPRTIAELVSLGRNARRAGRTLAACALDLLPVIAGIETATEWPSKPVVRIVEERR